jgi:endonuclease V-like protein UPF0215 family
MQSLDWAFLLKASFNVVDADVTNVEVGMPVRIISSERGGYKIHQAAARMWDQT